MSEGWVKIHRKLLDNPVVCKDTDYLAIWIFLLLNATHKEMPFMFNGKKIILKPGQLITCKSSICSKLSVNESKIFRVLKLFESEQQIEQQITRHGRLVTLLKWSDYQQDERLNEQQVNDQRTTSERLVNANKNVKNDQECKNEIFFNAFWAAYPNKKAKKDAIKAFAKIEMTESLLQEIITAVNRMKETRNWQEGFIPHPATYLNGERWKDEIPMKGGNNGKPTSDNGQNVFKDEDLPNQIIL